jgi:hypothetical protein
MDTPLLYKRNPLWFVRLTQYMLAAVDQTPCMDPEAHASTESLCII